MKRYSLTALILSLLAGLLFTACDSDDGENLVPSRDCIIQNIVLGTLEQPRTVKGSKGQDSTYIAMITGVQYPMSIDQINGRIFNPDSLPKGTDVTKVQFATLMVTGYTTVKSLITGEDTLMTINDTLDFTKPRVVTVHATDRRFTRDYTLEIRIHKESPDSIVWQNLTPTASSALQQYADCRVLSADNNLYVFGKLSDGTSQIMTTGITAPDFNSASALTTAEGQSLDIRSIQRLGQTFYGLSEGKVFLTQDATQPWTAAESNMAHFDAMVACSTDSLYALEGGKMYASADGCQWTASEADTENKWPAENIVSTLVLSDEKPGETTLLLAGSLSSEQVVWQHIFKKGSYFSYPWMFMPQTEELKQFAYPDLEQPTLISYDEMPLLFGIARDTKKPVFYQSADGGRTWKEINMKFPTPAETGVTAVAIDKDNYVWTVCCAAGQVFKGRHNRLGWLMR